MSFTTVLNDVEEGIKDALESGVTSVRRFYTNPPSVINEYPACIVYHQSGDWQRSTHSSANGHGSVIGVHTFIAEVAVPHKDLARDIATLRPITDEVVDALWKAANRDRFGGTVIDLGNMMRQSSTPPVRHEKLAGTWAGDNTIGIRFEIDVTVEREVEVG